MQGFPFHKWLVSVRDGTLYFSAKSAAIYDPALQEWFGAVIEHLGVWRKFWFARRRLGVYTSLFWEGSINYEVDGTPSGDFSGIEGSTSPPRGIAVQLLNVWSRWIRR